jgi:hypothetical protein
MGGEVRGLGVRPGFAGYSDLVAKFVSLGGTDGSEGLGDFAMGEFSEIQKAVLTELEAVATGGGAGSGFAELGKARLEGVQQPQGFYHFIQHFYIMINMHQLHPIHNTSKIIMKGRE